MSLNLNKLLTLHFKKINSNENPLFSDNLENTINFLNNHDIQGLKIHSTYIVKTNQLCLVRFYPKQQAYLRTEFVC